MNNPMAQVRDEKKCCKNKKKNEVCADFALKEPRHERTVQASRATRYL